MLKIFDENLFIINLGGDNFVTSKVMHKWLLLLLLYINIFMYFSF